MGVQRDPTPSPHDSFNRTFVDPGGQPSGMLEKSLRKGGEAAGTALPIFAGGAGLAPAFRGTRAIFLIGWRLTRPEPSGPARRARSRPVARANVLGPLHGKPVLLTKGRARRLGRPRHSAHGRQPTNVRNWHVR
jgi:hypothetical protein